MIIAIEPGCETGIAFTNHSNQRIHLSMTLDLNEYDDPEKATAVFKSYLITFFEKIEIYCVVVLQPFFTKHDKQQELIIKLTNAVHLVGYKYGKPRRELSSDETRKLILGSTGQRENETTSDFDQKMSDVVKKKGFNPKSTHEMGAAALLIAYMKKHKSKHRHHFK